MATVDIVVPCYRYGHFLEECVGSILNQSLDDVRILIIDDASPDDSAAAAKALIENFEARRYIGVPLLYCYDMTYQTTAPDGTPPYPHMLRWVR